MDDNNVANPEELPPTDAPAVDGQGGAVDTAATDVVQPADVTPAETHSTDSAPPVDPPQTEGTFSPAVAGADQVLADISAEEKIIAGIVKELVYKAQTNSVQFAAHEYDACMSFFKRILGE